MYNYSEVHVECMCTCTGLSNCCFKIIAFFLYKLMQDSPSPSYFINNPTVRKQQKQRERTASHWSQYSRFSQNVIVYIFC